MKDTMEKIIRNTIFSLAMSLAVFIGFGICANAYTKTTGTVTSDNVKVRESASTTSSQVSSVGKGAKVDIVDEEKDESGFVWYKIKVKNDEYGYVRSDLVSKSGGSTSSDSSETATQAVEQKSVEVLADSGTIRQGAGTDTDAVGKVKKGDTVTIIGEAKGSDGKKWYEVTFGENNSKGYIRSDLVADSAVASGSVKTEQTDAPSDGGNPEVVAELAGRDEILDTEESESTESEDTGEDSEETAEVASEPEAPVEEGDGKYSLTYEDESSTWYLNVIEDGNRVRIDNLMMVANKSEKYHKDSLTYKKIAIALGVLVGVFLIVVVVLALRLRDAAYYDDEEGDEDEEDENEEFDRYSSPSKKRSRDNVREDDEEAGLKKRRRSRDEDDDSRESRRPSSRRASADAAEKSERPERPVRRASASDDRSGRPVRGERPMRRNDESVEERLSRNADERTVRPSRRDDSSFGESKYDDRRGADRQPSDRRMRSEEPVRDESPMKRAKNFLGDDDDFEFEFLDLDDDDR